jgi:hypothetical protein
MLVRLRSLNQRLADLFTPLRVRLYPWVVASGCLVGFLSLVLTSDGVETRNGGRLGGDYPSFYAAGHTVHTGELDRLYDWPFQARLQAPHLRDDEKGTLIPFPYPPFVGQFYGLLAGMSFRTSFLVHCAFMMLSIIGGLALLRPTFRTLAPHFTTLIALSICFVPLPRAIFGGQNTAFSFLLICAILRGLHAEKPWLAGLGLGLLWYKPQYALVFALLFLFSKRWRELGVSLIAAAAGYTISALSMGIYWPVRWLEALQRFNAADLRVDLGHSISLHAMVSDALSPQVLSLVFTVALSMVTGLVVLNASLRPARSWTHRGVVASAGLFLIVPHVGFYDAGLLFIALLFLVDHVGKPVLPSITLLMCVAAISAAWDPPLTTPLFLVSLGVFAATVFVLRPDLNNRACGPRQTTSLPRGSS